MCSSPARLALLSRACGSPARLALFTITITAACTDPHTPASSATTTDSSGEAPAESTAAPTSTTTPPLDCAPLTRCGLTCVDLAANIDNCGECGVACRIDHATAECTDHACTFAACDPGYLDCDASLVTGCETPGATCPLVCAEDHPEVCNLFDDDCNDLCDDMAADCRHPIHRALSPTRGNLLTEDPSEASEADYTPITLSYLYLYDGAEPGLVPLYRCRLPDDFNYYTTSPNCDDQATLVAPLGFLAPTALCGAVPLFRLSNGVLTNYLYTHDPAERDDAINTQGYAYEAIAGYVWTSP